jgi:hypothetical protein
MSQGLKISQLPPVTKNNLETGDLLVIDERVREGVYATRRLNASYILKLKTEANNAGSDDSRVELYKGQTTSKTGTTVLNFRGLKAGTDIQLVQQSDNILINAKVDGENINNTIPNVYGGKNNTNANLRFRGITGTNGIRTIEQTDRIVIDFNASTLETGLIPKLPSNFPIQTIQAVKTDIQEINTDQTNWVNVAGLSLTLNRKTTGNGKVRIQANISCSTNNGNHGLAFRILRGNVPIGLGSNQENRLTATSVGGYSGAWSIQPVYLDFIDNSSGTNSSVDYKIQTRIFSSAIGYINRSLNDTSTNNSAYRTISTLTLTELVP